MATLPRLPPRRRDAHKGDFGRVLVFAGSYGMAGAAALCANAAYRGGAGLVTLAVPESIYEPLAVMVPCAVHRPLPADAGRALAELACDHDAIAAGPGIGTSPSARGALSALLAAAACPVVLDADALNLLAAQPTLTADLRPPRILTPHPGEAARLLGMSIDRIQRDRPTAARELARLHRATVVLKGAGTVVTDGSRARTNRTGNPGMATGGTGDVLTGLIAALLGQGLAPFDAAVLGVHLHGAAGDRAARRLGEVSLMATDLLDELPLAILALRRKR